MPGSNSSTDRIVVGEVGKPHGLDGTVVVRPDSDDPHRFARGARVWVGGQPREIEAVRATDGPLLVRFRGVSGRGAAESLRGLQISISESERRALGPDEFWPDQLTGMRIVGTSGADRGRVVGIVQALAQDRLEVDVGTGIAEIPFVAGLIEDIDLQAGVIRVHEVEGLFTPR